MIKSDSLHQIQRAFERLLRHHPSQSPQPVLAGQFDDSHGAMEECRLAVEQVVLPLGRPVELLPRNDRVRSEQAELVGRYSLPWAEFGSGSSRRLRVFPA